VYYIIEENMIVYSDNNCISNNNNININSNSTIKNNLMNSHYHRSYDIN
jgi:hypothetical protein